MTLQERIDAVVFLADILTHPSEIVRSAMSRAKEANVWFTGNSIENSFTSIASEYLDRKKIENWIDRYTITDKSPKTIGIVAAGNIPLVAFHDILCCFISGHRSKIKQSTKDEILFPSLLNEWQQVQPGISQYIEIVDRIKDIDAVIATGSDNSSRYFHYYFDKYPHIIRKNRVGVGVLYGNETDEELVKLGNDVFQYFGLGCRNVSSLKLPRGYDITRLLSLWESFKWVRDNHSYNNNFDYNAALYIMNNTHYYSNDVILLTENKDLQSRLASLNYEYYDDIDSLTVRLIHQSDQLQVIVSKYSLNGLTTYLPGQAQSPGLMDYADGIDTMKFLTSL